MPKRKIYTAERQAFTIRIEISKLEEIRQRCDELSLKTLQRYIDKIIDEDLIVASVERRKAIIEKTKSTKS